jgi:hypothetical protein
VILTGENHSTGRKTYDSATVSTADPTWTGLGLNLGICSRRPATNQLTT